MGFLFWGMREVNEGRRMKRILADWQFYLCLLLGPLSWWGITYFQPMRADLGFPAVAWYQFVLIILVYPLLEEIVFRGLLLELLAKRFVQRYGLLSVANLLTSLVFVLAHLIYSDWIWALLVFFPSIVFGYLKERHQSLLSPILMHGFYNVGFFWLFWP